MNHNFYYLVPEDYNNPKKLKNEYFIIQELIKKNINIIPLYKYDKKDIDIDITGIIFNSLKVISENKKILNFAKDYNIPIFWWYFDTLQTKFTRKLKVLRIAKKVSIFFNKDKSFFSNHADSKINSIWLDQGVPSECKIVENPKYKYDLSFFGSFEKVHSNRSKLLKEIDKNFNLVIYTKDKGKFLHQGFKNVKSYVPINQISTKIAKINLVLNGNYNSPYCWSNRVHLIIGSGGFSLVEDIKGINDYYKDNKHCIYFTNQTDLIEKINYWLLGNNNNKREIIRKEGFKHSHDKNSYEVKTNFFINNIKDYLKSNSYV